MRCLALACLVLVACVDPAEAPAVSDLAKGSGGCEDFVCGNTNSPEIDHLGLHELNLSYPNYQPEPKHGFALVSFTKDGQEYIPQVVGATLTGRLVSDPTQVLAGLDLEGARFLVKGPSAIVYNLQITSIGSVDYWAQPGGAIKSTPYYMIIWAVDQPQIPDSDWKSICSGPPPETVEDAMNLPAFAVVLFEGDRIDAATKSVLGVDPSWMNIGCAGHAVSKLHLTGHSEGAQVATAMDPFPFTTRRPERTTMLKMLAADYCNTGKAFTISGQPLGWIDHRHWMSYAASPTHELEARWTATGASCLNKPRVLANPSDEAQAQFPDVTAAIEKACGGRLPPSCAGANTELAGHHLISANPIE